MYAYSLHRTGNKTVVLSEYCGPKTGIIFENTEKSEVSREEKNLRNALDVKRRIRKKTSLLFESVLTARKKNLLTKSEEKKTVSFLTLTLSDKQNHSDTEIKKILLNRFLSYFRKHFKGLIYVCRQEYQKNGNVHFHLILNYFVSFRLALAVWNSAQDSAGYLENFTKKYGFHAPNSVDVRFFNKIENMAKYAEKYLTKSNAKNEISNKLFTSSSEFSKFKTPVTELDSKKSATLNNLLASKKCFVKNYDYCDCIYFDEKKYADAFYGDDQNIYDDFYMSFFETIYAARQYESRTISAITEKSKSLLKHFEENYYTFRTER